MHDPCTIDNDLQAPEAGHGLFNRAANLILLGHIAFEEDSFAAPASDLLNGAIPRFGLDIYYCNLGSFRTK
jgi:hypothetical protein